jgi:hypothetical protein
MAERVAQGTPSCVADGFSRLYSLHRWSVLIIIARDFTDHVAINSDLRTIVNTTRTRTSLV